MNILIIDPEKDASNHLSKLLQLFCPEATVVGSTNEASGAIQLIATLQPDLIFIDVELSMKKPFEALLEMPERKFHTVITAAHDKYAIQAIRMDALDYLLKPIDPNLLKNCIQKATKKLQFYASSEEKALETIQRNKTDKLGIPTCNGIRYIALENIVYFKSQDNYTEVILESGKPILISKALKSFESILENTIFTRVHQSYLVNMEKVTELQRVGGGMLILNNNCKIPISRSKKDFVKKRLEAVWRMVS
jgi:two-component system LytT family response regulator